MSEFKETCACSEHVHPQIENTENRMPLVPRTSEEKRKILNRLKRVAGQVHGIEKMVDEDRYCVDILIQLSAIQAALKKISFSVLERHAKSCVTKAVKEGRGEEQINELVNVLKHFK